MPSYTIKTRYNNTVDVYFNKFVVQKNTPLLVKELTPTMGEKGCVWTFTIYVLGGDVFEIVGELWYS